MKAVECERIHFLSQDPSVSERALLYKSLVLLNAGDTTEALKTLGRINMYQLSGADRTECEHLQLSLQTAADSNNDASDGKTLKHVYKAFLPPLGHIEAGEPGRGVLMTLLDAGSIAFGVWQCVSGQWITGYLVGAVGLDIFYYDEAIRLIR